MATQYWYPLTRFEWHGKAFVASLQASQAPLAGKKIWRFHCCEGDQRFNLWGPKKNPTKKGTITWLSIVVAGFCWFFPFRFLRCHGTRMGSGTQFTVDRLELIQLKFPDVCFGEKWVEEWGVRSFLACTAAHDEVLKNFFGGSKKEHVRDRQQKFMAARARNPFGTWGLNPNYFHVAGMGKLTLSVGVEIYTH